MTRNAVPSCSPSGRPDPLAVARAHRCRALQAAQIGVGEKSIRRYSVAGALVMRLTFQWFLFVLVCAHTTVLHAQAPVTQSAELKELSACAPVRANVPSAWVETPIRERFSLSLPPT